MTRLGHIVEAYEASPFRAHTFLVVEDDIEAGELLRELLEVLGARVSVARDGVDGLHQLAETRVDAVLCALAIPVMDGLEFARRVRRDPRSRRTLLVAVTERQDHEDLLQTWDAGFDAHLVKPVTVEMLRALAHRCASHRRRDASRLG